jgi:hypothetical protein
MRASAGCAILCHDAMRLRVIHVRCTSTGVWSVQVDGEGNPVSIHGTETEAERAAHEHAEAHGDGPVIVHDRYARTRVVKDRRSPSGLSSP